MTRYRERLIPGAGAGVALLLLLPAVYLVLLPLGLPGVVPLLGAAAATLAAEAVLFGTAPVVEVAGGELRAGPARIPVSLTGETEPFHGSEATAARGTGLDARAFTLMRGWIDPVLRVRLTDPDDPAPYWVVSTRRPERLAAALAEERAAATAA